MTRPDDPALPSLRARLAAFAPQPQSVHLLADGTVIAPDPASPRGTWRFAIPAATALRLRSPAASPAEAFGRADIRRLGIRLRAATLEHAGRTTALDLARPDLGEGWHRIEETNGVLWRWTNGDALLPLAAPGPATVTLHGYALLQSPGHSAA